MHRRRKAIHAFWKQQDDLVQKFLNEDSAPQPFLKSFYHVIEAPADSFVTFVNERRASFEASIMESRNSPHSRAEIPALTHRIWLTSADESRHPPTEYLTNYFKAARELPLEAIHLFWTNSTAVASAVRESAVAAGCPNVSVMDIALFGALPVLDRVKKLIADRKFVLAADMLKFVVLERYGGIYSDLGMVYNREIFELVLLSDYAFIVSNATFFQTSFVACAPHSELASIFLAIMHVPSAFDPKYALMGDVPTALDEVHIFAGLGFTACTILFLPLAARALMLPAQSPQLMWASQESWYGTQPKHGNALIQQTLPSLTSVDEFDATNHLIGRSIKFFGPNAFLAAQMRILVALHAYFAAHPTRMCSNFFYQGSDKALHWHNYGFIYQYLLGRKLGFIRSILEIGIGTDKLDVPSTMGKTGVPGASLRAWKESFPQAGIVGADVDIRILFQEPAIETYWVDQTRPEAVRQLFKNIGPRSFDVIIDDGLHTFEANRTLMDGAYPNVASDGIYIIEDVSVGDMPAWEAYLSSIALQTALIRLPHPTNESDNCLIIIPGGQVL
jgi:hypothetical protein